MMSEVTLETRQPIKSELEIETSENKKKPHKKETFWQRFCNPFRECFESTTDCLDFWCCRNECFNFCCNYDDVDDDEDYIRDTDAINNEADLPVISHHSNRAYDIDTQNNDNTNTANNINDGHRNHHETDTSGSQYLYGGGKHIEEPVKNDYHSGGQHIGEHVRNDHHGGNHSGSHGDHGGGDYGAGDYGGGTGGGDCGGGTD